LDSLWKQGPRLINTEFARSNADEFDKNLEKGF
jgi:hypothetical protein